MAFPAMSPVRDRPRSHRRYDTYVALGGRFDTVLSVKVESPRVLALSWLLLIHQLPAKPAYLRVKIWRRLQGLGAVAVKNAVYALPTNERGAGGFRVAAAGDRRRRRRGIDLRGAPGRRALRRGGAALFDAARDADYAALAKEARALAKRCAQGSRRRASGTSSRPGRALTQAARRDRRHRLLRRQRARNGRGVARGPRGAVWTRMTPVAGEAKAQRQSRSRR